ncbi:hypothetical protein M408DRAFT_90756 [Serendipita vermifera MAFF 305830]|uniref:CID domain-containing protein n=1 Tax=Serendipita vermifera MAFF 305830 TaxID=933852 RepID=A0A0C2XZ47_SERVB|nr:hypothetical protein M408DRAFT_90756 [Serendipita vermifera MAFF 305830]
MVDFKEIETLLKDVVGDKKLSGTKITKLQELAMKALKHDTKLVSMLYRTHKSLPTSQKVSSLYVFDALARAAKHQANKRSLPIKEIGSDKPGNAGTFLFKLEGILDGLVEDMVAVGTPEATEKTRKVLEIWTKANTFPADVLSRLMQSVNPGGKGTSGETQSGNVTPPTTTTPTQGESQASLLNDLPPAILALLGSNIAAKEGTGAPSTQPVTTINVAPNPPVSSAIDPSQLALLQHLTQQAQLSGALTSTNYYSSQPLVGGTASITSAEPSYTTGPVYVPPQAAPNTRRLPEEREDPRRSAYNRDRYDSSPSSGAPGRGHVPNRPGQDRYNRSYEETYDDDHRRRRPVGRERDGAGSRWERAPLPPRRGGGSRSRSRSPPARNSDPRIASPVIKTQSIPTFMSNTPAAPPPPLPITRPIETFQSRDTPAAAIVPQILAKQAGVSAGAGLDSFDLSTFDMTSSVHWMNFGAAFKVTHGKDATQEELMSTFAAMKNGLPPPTFGNAVAAAPIPTMTSPMVSNMPNGRNAWQPTYAPPQPVLGQRINAWETREDDERRRGNRQVGHGSYDGAGLGHATYSGRWQSDAVVLAGEDD